MASELIPDYRDSPLRHNLNPATTAWALSDSATSSHLNTITNSHYLIPFYCVETGTHFTTDLARYRWCHNSAWPRLSNCLVISFFDQQRVFLLSPKVHVGRPHLCQAVRGSANCQILSKCVRSFRLSFFGLVAAFNRLEAVCQELAAVRLYLRMRVTMAHPNQKTVTWIFDFAILLCWGKTLASGGGFRSTLSYGKTKLTSLVVALSEVPLFVCFPSHPSFN